MKASINLLCFSLPITLPSMSTFKTSFSSMKDSRSWSDDCRQPRILRCFCIHMPPKKKTPRLPSNSFINYFSFIVARVILIYLLLDGYSVPQARADTLVILQNHLVCLCALPFHLQQLGIGRDSNPAPQFDAFGHQPPLAFPIVKTSRSSRAGDPGLCR